VTWPPPLFMIAITLTEVSPEDPWTWKRRALWDSPRIRCPQHMTYIRHISID
jgi:hypothetical protein